LIARKTPLSQLLPIASLARPQGRTFFLVVAPCCALLRDIQAAHCARLLIPARCTFAMMFLQPRDGDPRFAGKNLKFQI
jgi:hypothetical protein